MQLYDDTEPGNTQSNYVTKETTPKVSEDTLTHFIKSGINNGGQGVKGETFQGRKIGTYPRHKRY